jgi:hypothetical protein
MLHCNLSPADYLAYIAFRPAVSQRRLWLPFARTAFSHVTSRAFHSPVSANTSDIAALVWTTRANLGAVDNPNFYVMALLASASSNCLSFRGKKNARSSKSAKICVLRAFEKGKTRGWGMLDAPEGKEEREKEGRR